MYKQSMFNHAYYDESGKVKLYNSYIGFDSLTIMDKKEFEDLCSRLNDKGVDSDLKFQVLKQKGFFVESNVNEKMLRELKHMDVVEENVLRLIILPTEKCNFRCKYCYEDFKKGKMSSVIQDSLIRYVQKNIMSFSSLDVRWFGGEPLEAIDVIEHLSQEFIRICKNAKRPYTASMTTNGYNLTLENFYKLYKLHIYNYQITIDGVRETHDSQRILANGQGTFDKIVSNLVSIKENVKSGIPRFTIRTNFTKSSAKYIDEYLRFFSDLFSNDIRFSFSVQKASDWGGDRVKDMSENLIDENFYVDILKYISKNPYNLDFSPHGALMNSSTCVCYANKRNSFVIGSDGCIYKCTGDFTLPENKIGWLVDGNMRIDANLHSKWLCTSNRNYEKCDNCFYSGACLFASCPSSFIKDQRNEDNICLFEEAFINEFLQLFDTSNFTVL